MSLYWVVASFFLSNFTIFYSDAGSYRRYSDLLPRGVFLSDRAANNYDPWFFKHKTLRLVYQIRVCLLSFFYSGNLAPNYFRLKAGERQQKSAPAIISHDRRKDKHSNRRISFFQSNDLSQPESAALLSAADDDSYQRLSSSDESIPIIHLDDAIPTPLQANRVSSTSPQNNTWDTSRILAESTTVQASLPIENRLRTNIQLLNEMEPSKRNRFKATFLRAVDYLVPVTLDFHDRTLFQKMFGIITAPACTFYFKRFLIVYQIPFSSGLWNQCPCDRC